MELSARPTVVCAYGVLVVGAIVTGLNCTECVANILCVVTVPQCTPAFPTLPRPNLSCIGVTHSAPFSAKYICSCRCAVCVIELYGYSLCSPRQSAAHWTTGFSGAELDWAGRPVTFAGNDRPPPHKRQRIILTRESIGKRRGTTLSKKFC